MDIDARRWGYNTDYYDITIKSENTTVVETGFDQEQVDEIATSFLNDTLLAPLSNWEVIDKLIEVGILSEDQINSWFKEQGSND